MNVLLFVFHIDVVLLSLFAFYAALTLPRALVRLFQPSELLNGFFLRSGTLRTHHQAADAHGRSSSTRRAKPIRSTSTRTNQTGRTLVDVPEDAENGNGKVPGGGRAGGAHASRPALVIPSRGHASHRSAPSSSQHRAPPTRVPRWTTIVHPTLAYALNFRVAPGFSFGKLLVLVVYAGLMFYASLRRSNPFTDPVRTGYVAMSQIPIAVALAGKTNWLSWACGVGYEKVWFAPPTLPLSFGL
jgi:ferric-chelate reductase